MASQRLRRLWITSFRTEETRSSSGKDRTGRRCVRSATTGRPEERTAIRRIDTESVEAGEVIILKTRGTGDRRPLLRLFPRN